MKVIHYIADITANAGTMAINTRAIILSMAKMAECHLITTVPLSESAVSTLATQYGITVHIIPGVKSNNPLHYIAAYRRLKKEIRNIQPDIVHVHGSWDHLTALAERAARRQNIVTIVSPHGGLSPAILGIDFWKVRLPRLLLYQAMMVRQSTCVIALSQKERDDILSTALKKRIEIVPCNGTASPDNNDAIRTAVAAAYRKALDSTYTTRLTNDERSFVEQCVKAAILEPEYLAQSPATLPDTKTLSFRRIFFHAYDEDVTQLMLTGAQKLSIALPPTLDVQNTPRYANKKAKRRGSLIEAPLKVKHLKIPAEQQTETLAVTQFYKASLITIPRLTLRQEVELYRLFFNTDFNEDLVGKELKRLSAKRFIKKLQKRYHALYALPSGYNIY